MLLTMATLCGLHGHAVHELQTCWRRVSKKRVTGHGSNKRATYKDGELKLAVGFVFVVELQTDILAPSEIPISMRRGGQPS